MLKDILTQNRELNDEINKIDKDLTFIKSLIDGEYTTSDEMVQNPVNCYLIHCK